MPDGHRLSAQRTVTTPLTLARPASVGFGVPFLQYCRKSQPSVQFVPFGILSTSDGLSRAVGSSNMNTDPALVGLPAGLSLEDAATQFDSLQKKLVPLWRSIESFNQDEQTIVVVPSMSIDMAITGLEVQAYEERFLFLLLLLTQPRARMIYLTSQAIHPSVIEYYLDLLPGIIPRHALRRLTLLAPYDDSPRPLSLKVLERPRLLQQIEASITDKNRAHLVCYNTTYFERNLALRLGIPLYGADPCHLSFGTKTGCRQLFAQAGINHPLGFDDLTSLDEVVSALTADAQAATVNRAGRGETQ